MTVNELIQKETERKSYTVCEVFKSLFGKRSFHTDEVEWIDDDDMDKNVEVFDYAVMDEAEYNRTILANTSASFSDIYDNDDKVLVILVK